MLEKKMALMEIRPDLKTRNVNENFSGGEKKRNEILQMAVLNPDFALLDETDSGLDIDAMRIVAHGVNQLMNPEMGLLLITHYQRLLDYIRPHFVHVMLGGQIVRSGGPELALELEDKGYDWLINASQTRVN
jgi:Fe-S cluster assembly ATP-binding protein